MENLLKVAVLGSVQAEWLATGRGKMSLPHQLIADDQITTLQLAEFALSNDEQRMLRAMRCLDGKAVSAVLVLAESLGARRRTRTSLM